MTQYKHVYDHIAHLGSAGLYDALARHNLSESAWNYISYMHVNNPAPSGFGLVNIVSDFNQLADNHNTDEHAGADVASQSDDLPDNPLANDITGKTPAPGDSNPSPPGDSNPSHSPIPPGDLLATPAACAATNIPLVHVVPPQHSNARPIDITQYKHTRQPGR
ncbi:hypothetical protein VP01_4141g3 [Puccinia sorghi]|uniref:Uncharacterized protein n=1 Tax=Puccinia sorghi TaxID=27349 RepID=A0A0L6UR41_9BASI|nr:hypothetical protein VP01_4141g3 [Puccinia sorghi]